MDLYLTYDNICHSNFQSPYNEKSVLCNWNKLGKKIKTTVKVSNVVKQLLNFISWGKCFVYVK